MIDLLEIKDPSFLKGLNKEERLLLADNIRSFLISKISQTGGHLSSNLGTIELITALYYVFDPEKDQFLFDVGHQAYTAKILTGRAKDFDNLRKLDGLSGFPSYAESKYDNFESGHGSTTISAAYGLSESNKKKSLNRRIISIIGDGAIAGGVAFEGLNFLSYQENPIIIINDNGFAIDEAVGKLADFFKEESKNIKTGNDLKNYKQNNNLFTDLGYLYYGIYDGNDLELLISLLKDLKEINKPLIFHIHTKKGNGYEPALSDTTKYHGLGKFDILSGEVYDKADGKQNYSTIIAKELMNLRKNIPFSVINPAMITSSDLKCFKEKYPNDTYDFGLSEEHAVLVASMMAKENNKVIVSLYSTFAQRAYDQILNDVSRPNLNVFFLLDHSGLVSGDGGTHQGIYDLSMFRSMPNMKIMMAKNSGEAKGLLEFGLNYQDGPIVLRYEKERVSDEEKVVVNDMSWVIEQKGTKAIIISYGLLVSKLLEMDLDAYIVNARFLRPLDKKMFSQLLELNLPILIYEEVIESSSLYEAILAYLHKTNEEVPKIKALNIDNNEVIAVGTKEELLHKYHLDEEAVNKALKELTCD